MKAAMEDRQAEMATLVRSHQAGVWRYLRYLGCPPVEADDLTQETFLAVFRDGFEDRSETQTAAYLRTVARNRLLTVRRSQKMASEVDLEAAEAVWAETVGDRGLDDYLVALEDCLEVGVTPRVRRALELLYRDRLSRSEIADELEMAVEGVKTLLRRARAALRECVERKLGS
jgi:RNA polymerase sigma-70 factor (ECF subfamily)